MYVRRVVRAPFVLAIGVAFAGALPAPAVGQESEITLEIQTVPRLDGIRFSLDGRRFVSDSSGVAQVTADAAGSHELRVFAPVRIGPEARAEFSAWSDGVEGRQRTIGLEGSTVLQAAFITSQLVGQVVLDSEGRRIEARSVDSLELADDAGNTVVVPGWSPGLRGPTALLWQRRPAGTRWLPSGVVEDDGGRLTYRTLTYRVQSVTISGERRRAVSDPFVPADGQDPTVSLPDYSAAGRGGAWSEPALWGAVVALAAAVVLAATRLNRREPAGGAPGRQRAAPARGDTVDGSGARRDHVRVHLDSGRSIEGYRRLPGTDARVVIVDVIEVRDADGHPVAPMASDLFVQAARIERIDTLEEGSSALSPVPGSDGPADGRTPEGSVSPVT
jgi:hypothetical protein